MSSNVRSHAQKKKIPMRFSESPLEVYDVEEWDPIMDLSEDLSYDYDLDLSELEGFGSETGRILTEYGANNVFVPESTLRGEEVGDDRCDRTRDPRKAATALVVQEAVLEMKTSQSDTFISKLYFNFCEVTSLVPSAKDQSFDQCRKVGDFRNLGYTDVPPLRIILDVSKGDMSHSSTVPGKSTMLGNRMRTPRSELLESFYLASYLQDGFLRTCRSTEPKYLPQIMGGSGVRAPFGEAENLYLSVHAYRNGGYQRIYGTATAELQRCVELLEQNTASMPVLCQRLRDKQEYLHGTYAEKVFIPTHEYMDSVMDRLPTPLLKASGGANRFSNYETRLERTRHLVSRSAAIREWGFTTRIRDQLLRHLSVPESDLALRISKSRGRANFGFALNANSAFKNLLDRKATPKDVQELTNQDFLIVNTGVTQFTKWDAEWLFHGGKRETFSIEDLTTTEDMFLRTEVSEEETFKVGGLTLKPIGRNSIPIQKTTTRVGLYQINSSMTEWADNLVSKLVLARRDGESIRPDIARRIFLEDPEWVNDDSGLIDRCLKDTEGLHYRSARVVLVTLDKRLANQMAQTCRVQVIRLAPLDYILWCRERNLDFQQPLGDIEEVSLSLSRRNERRKDPIRAVYVDTGSIASVAAKLQEERLADGNKVVIRQYVESGLDTQGHRYVRYNLIDTEIPNDLRSTLHEPVSRPKRFQYTGGPLISGRPQLSRGNTSTSSGGSNASSWR